MVVSDAKIIHWYVYAILHGTMERPKDSADIWRSVVHHVGINLTNARAERLLKEIHIELADLSAGFKTWHDKIESIKE